MKYAILFGILTVGWGCIIACYRRDWKRERSRTEAGRTEFANRAAGQKKK